MLTKLSLHNFRCFKDSDISFRDTSIVVGNNNAGKSTLVEALRIIGECCQKYKRATYVQAPAQLSLPLVTKGFKLNLDNLKIDLRTVVYQYQQNVFAEIRAFFQNNTCIKVFLSDEIVFAVIENDGHIITSRTQAQKIEDLQLYIMPQIGLIREEEGRLSDDTVKKDMSSRLSSRHFRNELLLYKEHFDTFRDLAQNTWSGLRISDISYRYGENISLFVTDDDYAAEIGMMGSGLQMWLQIIWFVSRCPESATVVLDEPDVYMHPDLQRKILTIVQRRFNQIIIATHSIEIISCVEPRQIVTVDKKSRRMQYANNYRAVQDIISNLGSEHNLSLIRIGNAKKCVFVEGNDIATLKKFQDILFPHHQYSIDQLPTVSLGGWSRFNEALGAARLFYEETQGEIKTFCILDRDYHTDEEVQKLYELSTENHLELHVWRKKEIENYILVPAAIARVAGITLEGPEYSEFEHDLFIELDKLAAKTRGSIIDQYCLQDRSKNPSYYIPAAEAWFNRNWDSLEGRLSIACGKDIISLINSWIKTEFKRSSSRSRILSALKPRDIPDEMKQVIETLIE